MIKIFGHRGDPARFPDNSLEGIRAAANVCDGVEIDFRRTRDGHLVLAHDPEIDDRVIAETDLVDLPELATAAELFAMDLDTGLDLEVKNLPTDSGFERDHRIGLEVAERARRQDLVTCFYWPTVDRIHEEQPDVTTGLLFERIVPWRLAVRHAISHEHRVIAPYHSIIDAKLVEAAHEASIEVAAWTVDDRDRVLELADLGVDTIITNVPTDAVGWIQEYSA